MSPKFINLEIILVFFILLIPWPGHVVRLLCPKDNSRLVRKIVRSKWTPILDKYQVKFPLECPLHPFRDLFSPRQDAKKRDRPTQWTCRLCGKSFYQEKFLDHHFETRHNSIINEAEEAICLADYCDIMRCDVFQTEESSSLKTPDQHVATEVEVWGDAFGQNSAIAKAKAPYLSLVPLRGSPIGASRATKVQSRQLCQEKIGQNNFKKIVDNSKEINEKQKTLQDATQHKKAIPIASMGSRSPGNGHPASSVKLSGTSSQALPGTAYPSPSATLDKAKTGKSERQSSAKSNQSDSNKNGHDRRNLTSKDKSINDNTTHSQRIRANCKAEDLSKLRLKCERLVRSCIGGLLLSMSDQSFHKMEEEMNKAVCWYLTCDRYWEDGPLESRAFPWLLILVLILVLSTGICFCYYIIWILFDSEESTITSNHHIYMPQEFEEYPIYGVQPHHRYYQADHDIYPTQQTPYDYRHSPRQYIVEHQGSPTPAGQTTPLRHHQTHHYQSDILDPRDNKRRSSKIASRPIATSAVTGSSGNLGPNASATTAFIGMSEMPESIPNMRDCDTAILSGHDGMPRKHYNTHPRTLDGQRYYGGREGGGGAQQQTLRGTTSSHEIVQNEIGHNEHYIYVTYPPDLKKRYFEKYE